MVESVGKVGARAGSRMVMGDAGQAKHVAHRSSHLALAIKGHNASLILSLHSSSNKLSALSFWYHASSSNFLAVHWQCPK